MKSGTNKCTWCLENKLPSSDDSLSIRYKTDEDIHLRDIVAGAVEAQRVTNYERAKSPNSTQTYAAHAYVVLLEPTLPSSTALVACTGPKKRILVSCLFQSTLNFCSTHQP